MQLTLREKLFLLVNNEREKSAIVGKSSLNPKATAKKKSTSSRGRYVAKE